MVRWLQCLPGTFTEPEMHCPGHFAGILVLVLLQHKTIDSVLERGEKLDTLVEKSNDLSMASQVRAFHWASSLRLAASSAKSVTYCVEEPGPRFVKHELVLGSLHVASAEP